MEHILKKWGKHPAFGALEPVNEPWWFTPLDELKGFYRTVRQLVVKYAPDAKFVFHDSFRFDPNLWNDLFEDNDHENVVMDHHYYHAFFNIDPKGNYTVAGRCDLYKKETEVAKAVKYDVWFGEWALAIDNCAHWLNGFNDAGSPPQYACKPVECPKSYMPAPHAVDFNRSAEILGPFGYQYDPKNQQSVMDSRVIKKGMCWTDSEEFNAT